MSATRLTAVLLAGALALNACAAAESSGDAERIDPGLVADLGTEDAREAGEAVNAFGFDLLGAIAEHEEAEEATAVTSPLSVAVLLAMVLAGAEGDTASAMAEVLRLEEARDPRTGALLGRVADTEEVTLSVANALWSDLGVSFEEDYESFVTDTFGATLEEADLGAPETAEEIDAWVADNTGGRIEEIAADLGLPDPGALIVLLNAVYFLGEWSVPFDEEETQEEAFTLGDGQDAQVPMMHLAGEEFGYAERDGYRMLRLPYGEKERYGMEILLPDSPDGLGRLVEDLDAAEWRAAVDDLEQQEITELALPRFELEWELELTGVLADLGMEPVLSPGAELGAMSPAATHVDTVVHKTYIRVDEEGTEAAGATGAEIPISAPLEPVVFRAEHPFAFSVSDTETGTVLFLGGVADPRG